MRAAYLIGALSGLLLAGCGGGSERRDASAETAADSTAQRYKVRGIVVRLPTPERREVYIHHEAIPDFVGIEGEVVGMTAMTMPFVLAEKASLGQIGVGDKVAFVLEVDWERADGTRITAIERLPETTALEVGAAVE